MAGRNQAATQANTKHSKIVGIRSQGQMSGSPFLMISSPSQYSFILCVQSILLLNIFWEKKSQFLLQFRFIITTGYLRMFSAPAHKSLSFITRKPKNCFWKAESCCIILLYTFHNSAIYSSCWSSIQLTLDNFIWLGKTSGFVFHYPILFPISKYWIKFPVAHLSGPF